MNVYAEVLARAAEAEALAKEGAPVVYCEACGAALVPPALIAREWRHHGKAIRDRQRRKTPV